MTLTSVKRAGLHSDALDRVFTIGASGSSAYTFQGEGLNGTVNNPTLYLARGKTYRFENGSGGHPIRIQSTSGASGTAYNTGVTNNAGSGTVIVEVQHDAPDVLYYQCTSHAAMNGILYIVGALADGGVTTAKIATDAVTQPKIAASAIHTENINDNAVTTAKITDSNITTAKIANGAVGTTALAANAVTNAKLADDAVTHGKLATGSVGADALADASIGLDKLIHGTSSNDGKFLRANNGADPTFETVSIPAGTTINNNANNRLITGSGTANTLEGESALTFDGSNLILGSGKGIKTNFIRHADGSNTNTGNANQQYWKIGEIGLNGSEGAVITLVGANGYSGGSYAAGETTIVLRGSNSSTLLGFWYSDTPGGDTATYSDVRWKHISGVNYELWVSAGPYNNVAPAIVKTTGSFDNTNAAGTGSNNAPSGSTALMSSHRKKVGSIDTIEYQSTGTIFKRNIVMDSSYGIDFSATSNYGTSTPAELLDDYEEGQFEPAFSTPNGQILRYTYRGEYCKIGRVVHCMWSISSNGTSGSTSGIVSITGFPFSGEVPSANGPRGGGGVIYGGYGSPSTLSRSFIQGTTLSILLNDGSYLEVSDATNTGGNGFQMSGMITYLTTQI